MYVFFNKMIHNLKNSKNEHLMTIAITNYILYPTRKIINLTVSWLTTKLP